jgi:hypothetical protein
MQVKDFLKIQPLHCTNGEFQGLTIVRCMVGLSQQLYSGSLEALCLWLSYLDAQSGRIVLDVTDVVGVAGRGEQLA